MSSRPEAFVTQDDNSWAVRRSASVQRLSSPAFHKAQFANQRRPHLLKRVPPASSRNIGVSGRCRLRSADSA